ncbi:MAG TPA: polyhydroxyalkanoate granule-associated phasin [Burkholderiaceae bacterium]|nr:polyhydroxyalkanoate granule-associated phasin [Burkholderiaceae bacterium]
MNPYSIPQITLPRELSAWTRNAMHLAEIWTAAPQVIAHRVQRMMMAGPQPVAGDRREFIRMGQEKVEAFAESMAAMSWRLVQAQQAFVLAWMQQGMRMMMSPLAAWTGGTRHSMPRPSAALMHQLVASGLRPVHRRVTANAKRLAAVPPQRTTNFKG